MNIIREKWKSIENKPSWIQAFSTVILVLVTGFYVIYTRKQVNIQLGQLKKQEQHFEHTNRAIINYLGTMIGDNADKGIAYLANVGNLPANNFELRWEFFYATANGKPMTINKGKMDKVSVYPDEVIEVICNSKVTKPSGTVFLNVIYQYRCQGLEHIRKKEFFANWHPEGSRWVINNMDLNSTHLDTIYKAKKQLWESLEKEN